MDNILIYALIGAFLIWGPICAWIARAKRRSIIEGYLIGLVLGIIGVMLMAIQPTNEVREIRSEILKP